jgi:hypothetical protein
MDLAVYPNLLASVVNDVARVGVDKIITVTATDLILLSVVGYYDVVAIVREDLVGAFPADQTALPVCPNKRSLPLFP